MLMWIGYHYTTSFDVYGDSLSYFCLIVTDILKNSTNKEYAKLTKLFPGYQNVCISFTINKTINENS